MARLRSFCLALGAAWAALGCGAQAERPVPPPDCNAGAGSDFLSPLYVDASKLMPGTAPTGFNFGDTTPGATLTWQAADVDPSSTCGRSRVIDMQSFGHNDYGSSFFLSLSGSFGQPVDATGAEGISFWAKGPLVPSDRSFILELSDRYSDAAGMITVDGVSQPACTNPSTTMTPSGSTMGVQSGTNSTNVPGYVPAPTDCGNFFQSVFQFSSEWTLYRLPFQLFAQSPLPNRQADGIDTSALFYLIFQIPKETKFELWIDQIGAYKPTSADAGP